MARKQNKEQIHKNKASISTRNRYFAIGSIAAVIIVLAVAIMAPSLGITGQSTSSYGDIEKALQELEAGVGEGKIGRDDYLPAKIYENLPPMPDDFWSVKAIVEAGRLKDLKPFGPEYYKQPEWYDGWIRDGVPLHQNPPTDRYGIWGYGAFFADQSYSSLPGDEFTAVFYMHTSWMIQSYQGMWLKSVFPSFGVVHDVTVNQDSSKAAEYFDVSIAPDIFVLGPTFPIFDYDWTRRIDVNVKIAENTPPGDYLVGVNPFWPPDDWDQTFLQQYKLKYARAGSTGVDRPYFQVHVEVRNTANG